MEPIFSVIICTYNGGKRILRTLEALDQQNFPKDDFEVIVVDNNSSDETPSVIQGFIGKQSGLKARYCFEGQQGQSYARNKGILEAKGKYVAFTDDDGVPDANWLVELNKIYQTEDRVGSVGGKVRLVLPPNLPDWYHEEMGMNYLAGFDLKVDYPLEVHAVYSFPYGVNISFLKKALLEVGLFNPQFGKKGGHSLTGDETDRCLALYESDWRIMYQPSAVVLHLIEPERISKAYFKKMAKVAGSLRLIWDARRNSRGGMFLRRIRYFLEAGYFFSNFLFLKVLGNSKSFKEFLKFESRMTALFYFPGFIENSNFKTGKKSH